MTEKTRKQIKINGKHYPVTQDSEDLLLWFLRENCGLTGTRFGCGKGVCGSCTVHVNGSPVRSCQMKVDSLKDVEVTTIEGLAKDSTHPLQKAWVKHQTPQCGYCQSGQIMAAAALLATNNNPSREEIIEHMTANLCRCGTYTRIIAAIQSAAKEMQL